MINQSQCDGIIFCIAEALLSLSSVFVTQMRSRTRSEVTTHHLFRPSSLFYVNQSPQCRFSSDSRCLLRLTNTQAPMFWHFWIRGGVVFSCGYV